MSVIIIAELSEKKIKKQSLEAISYGVAIANQLGTDAIALVMLSDNKLATKFIAEICNQYQAAAVVFSNSLLGKAVAPRLSVKLRAGLVTGAVKLPDTTNGFNVRKSVFSGKAFADVNIKTPIKIISLNANAFEIIQQSEAPAELIESSIEIGTSTLNIIETKKNEGSVSLADADRVVSGGRGLKGPENWGMIEELAQALGAATACSRPVADSNWRPHHEHVGQTGVAISPNLYIAVGISGAIQHLAGVNRSKTIVVINSDPEAPFFKAADYGIVGDAFQVMPKIIEAVKNLG